VSIFSALAHHYQNGMRAARGLTAPRIAFVLAIKAGYVERAPASENATVRQNEDAETSAA
jgi:hypothetical protein